MTEAGPFVASGSNFSTRAAISLCVAISSRKRTKDRMIGDVQFDRTVGAYTDDSIANTFLGEGIWGTAKAILAPGLEVHSCGIQFFEVLL